MVSTPPRGNEMEASIYVRIGACFIVTQFPSVPAHA
jgi:hypothetical protein